MSTKPLIIFDSGIGGLSILKVLLQVPFRPELLYFADQAYFPYGSQSAQFLRYRLFKLFSWFAEYNPLAVVVACNTATTVSLAKLRQKFNFPLIGVEPVIKPLSKFSPSLLLATPVTLKSARTQSLIKRYQPNQLYLHPSKNLASYIETMQFDKINQTLNLIKAEYNLKFKAIGLSCTHYPLIQDLISQTFPSSQIIEPSLAVVDHLLKVLPQFPPSNIIRWLTTYKPQFLAKQVDFYLNLKVKPLLATLG